MKQKFTLLILSYFISCCISQAQIPNAGFENWIFAGWFANPAGWNTNNMQLTSSVVAPDSDAYMGVYAMKLYNYGTIKPVAWTRFASSANVNNLTAYIKLTPVLGDTVYIKVREFYNGALLDSGEWKGYTSIPGYTLVNVPLSQNSSVIDTVEIEIAGGNHTDVVMNGTDFKVDHLQLSLTSGMANDFAFAPAVYPNPASGNFFITTGNTVRIEEIIIFNSMGNQVKKISALAVESLNMNNQLQHLTG